LNYLTTNSKNHLLKELSQLHAEGWSVEQYPQWLLFEIEQGVFIRTIQAEIAKQIIGSKVHAKGQKETGNGRGGDFALPKTRRRVFVCNYKWVKAKHQSYCQ
jgi:hypothetical protein